MSVTGSGTTSGIVWFELPAEDSERARDFYGRLLGWQFEPFEGQDYYMANDVGGAIYGMPGQKGLLAYFGVDEIDTAIERVRELGGDADERQEIPSVGRYARCTDTEGNPFGLYQSGGAS